MAHLVDLHCHLLAGLDDGPRNTTDALAMCRCAAADGVRRVAATAHQNERYADVTPDRIRTATAELTEQLHAEGIPLVVAPNAEVMADPDIEDAWCQGRVLSVGDRGHYLLVEMPHRIFVDLRHTVRRLAVHGVRVILAHPERHPELLHEPGALAELIEAGCLVQVSSGSVTNPASAADARALRDWFRRGCVHLLGSDGHSPRRRLPVMGDAYRQICSWIGQEEADRICSTNGEAVLDGRHVETCPPRRAKRWWPVRLW
jgi:protein-tyrosine phosphatase